MSSSRVSQIVHLSCTNRPLGDMSRQPAFANASLGRSFLPQSRPRCANQRVLQLTARAANPDQTREQSGNTLRPTITSTRAPRQSAPPPEQVPVEHSATYLIRSRRPVEEEELVSSSEPEQPFSGNAVEWYLRRLDRSADDEKAEPSPAAKAYYRASQTQAGSSAVRGVGSVVGTAAKLGAEAVKAAAPVGKWAVMQGLGAAGKLITSSSKKPPKNDKA